MKRALAALAFACAFAAPAGDALGDTGWQSNNDARGWELYGLHAPTRSTSAPRVSDLAPGACIPKSPGANTLPFICSLSGTDYLAPIGTSAGNYDRVSVAASGLVTGGAAMVVANVTALEALTGANYRDGSAVFVQSVAAEFVLHATSSVTVDHITIASVSGSSGARWIRRPTPDGYWYQTGTQFYLGGSGASDENNCTAAITPCATAGELRRRLKGRIMPAGATQSFTINVDSTFNGGDFDPLAIEIDPTRNAGTVVTFLGVPAVTAIGTIASVVAPVFSTGQPPEIVVTGYNWSTHVGKIIRKVGTTGTSSVTAVVAADMGTGRARLTLNNLNTIGGTAFAPGDVVEELTTLPRAMGLKALGLGAMFGQMINFDPTGTATSFNAEAGASVFIIASYVKGTTSGGGFDASGRGIGFYGCSTSRGQNFRGDFSMSRSVVFNSTITVGNSVVGRNEWQDTILVNSTLALSEYMHTRFHSLGIYDLAASAAGVTLATGASTTFTDGIYGTGNNATSSLFSLISKSTVEFGGGVPSATSGRVAIIPAAAGGPVPITTADLPFYEDIFGNSLTIQQSSDPYKKMAAFTNAGVAANQVMYADSTKTIAGQAGMQFDDVNVRLGVGDVGTSLSSLTGQLNAVQSGVNNKTGLAISTHITTAGAGTLGGRLSFRTSGGTFASPIAVSGGSTWQNIGQVGFIPHDGTAYLSTAIAGGTVTPGSTVATGSVPTTYAIAIKDTGSVSFVNDIRLAITATGVTASSLASAGTTYVKASSAGLLSTAATIPYTDITGVPAPTLTATQIAFGNVSNLMTSVSDFRWDDTNKELLVGATPTGGSTEIARFSRAAPTVLSFNLSNTDTGTTAFARYSVQAGAGSVFMHMGSTATTATGFASGFQAFGTTWMFRNGIGGGATDGEMQIGNTRTGTGNDIAFYTQSGGALRPLVITNGGLVGVGDMGTTTSPALSTRLHVVDNSAPATRGLMNSVHHSVVGGLGGRLRFNRSRGTFAAPTTLVGSDSDEIGTIAFGGYDGTTYVPGAVAGAYATGTVATGSVPMNYAIRIDPTGANTGLGSAQYQFSASGLGIGGQVARQRLDVADSTGTSQVHLSTAGADSGGYLTAGSGGTSLTMSGGALFNGTNWVAKATNASLVQTLAGGIVMATNDTLTIGATYSPTPRFTILSTGELRGSSLSAGGYVSAAVTTGQLSVSATIPYADITGAPAAITALTGDGTAAGPGSAALTLATVNSTVGSFTNANITVNAKGLITAASNGSGGGGGSVTAVTATLPMVSTLGTTPDISIQYDNSTITLSGGNALQRGHIAGDLDVPAGSNTSTLATVNASPGTYTYATVVVNGKGLATTVTSGAAPAPSGATYLTQTTNGTLSAEQAMTSLAASGVMTVNNSTGVVGSFGVGTARVPFGSGTLGGITDSANMQFNGQTFGLGSIQELQIYNASTSTTAIAGYRIGTDASFTNSFSFGMLGTNWSSGGLAPNAALFELNAGSAPYITSNYGTGKISFTTTSGRTERMAILTGGGVTVANLAGVGTRMVSASAAGQFGIATAGTDYQTPITWPAATYVLASSGTSTAPTGAANFTFDGTSLKVGNGSATSYLVGVATSGVSATYQAWKDATPSKAVGFGNGLPGGAPTDDALISTYSSGGSWTERVRVSNATGAITASSLTTGGVLWANTSGVIASAAVTAGRFLVSGGTGTPTSGLSMNYDFVNDFVSIEDDATLAVYAVGGTASANSSYLHVFGNSGLNTVNVVAERRGSTAVPALNVSAGVSTLTLDGATVATTATTATTSATNITLTGSNQVLLTSGVVTSPDVYVTPIDVNLRSNMTLASASNAALDAVKFNGALGLTGASTVTTEQNFNYFGQPTIVTNAAVNTATTAYFTGPPIMAGGTGSIGSAYTIHVASGLARFDGDGSGNVFEVPSHGCGSCVATVPDGRIPVLITGVGVRYIRYFTN